MCAGTRDDGSVIEDNDPIWPELIAAAEAAKQHPATWLEQRQIYGDIADHPGFASSFAHWLGMLWDKGCAATLEVYARQGVAQ